MLKCSAPGCPNLVPSTVDIVRGASLTVLCDQHMATITSAEVSAEDVIAAVIDASKVAERVREWNRQVEDVAALVADPERSHGLIVEFSRKHNTVTALESAALDRGQAYAVDLDRLAINPTTLNLTDIPFTTREDRP